MSVKGLLVNYCNQLTDAISGILTRMGTEVAPPTGDETLQRQHKTIEALLATITGSYKSSEDIIPEEHTITRIYTAPTGLRSFTFDESGYLLGITGIQTFTKINLASNIQIETGSLDDNGDTWTANDLITIRKCGTSYAVAVRNYAGTLNRIYIYGSTLTFTRKFDITDPILGMAWTGTYLAVQTTKIPAGGFGYQNTITYMDLTGAVQGTAKTDQRNVSVIGATILNNKAAKQELFYDDATFYFPKIIWKKTTGAIWGMTEDGFLTRILKFTDMTGTLTQDVSITALDYYDDYLYLLMTLSTESIIGVVRIND